MVWRYSGPENYVVAVHNPLDESAPPYIINGGDLEDVIYDKGNHSAAEYWTHEPDEDPGAPADDGSGADGAGDPAGDGASGDGSGGESSSGSRRRKPKDEAPAE